MPGATVSATHFTQRAQGASGFANLLNKVNQSINFVNQINNMSPTTTVDVAPENTVYTASNTIIGNDLFPGGKYAQSVDVLTTLVAHEVGHDTLPGGLPNFLSATTPIQAVNGGLADGSGSKGP